MKPRDWIPIEGTRARFATHAFTRQGVRAMLVWLRGASGDSANEVASVVDALDEHAARIEPEVDVVALDTSRFANAYGDEAGILTHVFRGLACCWATPCWASQVEGNRWDLPPAELLAPTMPRALERAVGLRQAGGFVIRHRDAGCRDERAWTERGFEVRAIVHDALDTHSVYYRNRLVERSLFGASPARVLWPFPDRSGAEHEALRRGARLVFKRGEVCEVDFSPRRTLRALPADWVERVEDLARVECLMLLGVDVARTDLLRAAAALPCLELLRLSDAYIDSDLVAHLRSVRPGLEVR